MNADTIEVLAIAQMQLIDEVFQALTFLEELGVFLVVADYDVSGLLIPVPKIKLLRQCFQVIDEKVEILQKSFFSFNKFPFESFTHVGDRRINHVDIISFDDDEICSWMLQGFVEHLDLEIFG